MKENMKTILKLSIVVTLGILLLIEGLSCGSGTENSIEIKTAPSDTDCISTDIHEHSTSPEYNNNGCIACNKERKICMSLLQTCKTKTRNEITDECKTMIIVDKIAIYLFPKCQDSDDEQCYIAWVNIKDLLERCSLPNTSTSQDDDICPVIKTMVKKCEFIDNNNINEECTAFINAIAIAIEPEKVKKKVMPEICINSCTEEQKICKECRELLIKCKMQSAEEVTDKCRAMIIMDKAATYLYPECQDGDFNHCYLVWQEIYYSLDLCDYSDNILCKLIIEKCEFMGNGNINEKCITLIKAIAIIEDPYRHIKENGGCIYCEKEGKICEQCMFLLQTCNIKAEDEITNECKTIIIIDKITTTLFPECLNNRIKLCKGVWQDLKYNAKECELRPIDDSSPMCIDYNPIRTRCKFTGNGNVNEECTDLIEKAAINMLPNYTETGCC